MDRPLDADSTKGDRTVTSDSIRPAQEHNSTKFSVGNMVWDSVKHMNPAFKGFAARELACGKNPSVMKSQGTVGDDQLLGSGEESARRGADMFEFLCKFRVMLKYLGYDSLRNVPIELVSIGTNRQRHMPNESKHQLSHAGFGQETTEIEGEGDDVEESEHEEEVTEIGNECSQSTVRPSTLREGCQDALDSIKSMASKLLDNFGFNEHLVANHIHKYLRNCRDATYECANPIRRIVYSSEFNNYDSAFDIAGPRNLSSSRSVKEIFKPSSKDETLRRYATESSRLVLFILRTVTLKMVYQTQFLQDLFGDGLEEATGSAPSGNGAPSFNSEATSRRVVLGKGLEALQNVLRENKLSVSGHGVLTARYKKLLSVLPDDIARQAVLYLLEATRYYSLATASDNETERSNRAWLDMQRSLHGLLVSVLTQKASETASTAGLFLRHFVAIMSVWHKKPRHKDAKLSSTEMSLQLSRCAVITSFQPSDGGPEKMIAKKGISLRDKNEVDGSESLGSGSKRCEDQRLVAPTAPTGSKLPNAVTSPDNLKPEESDPESFRIKRACEISKMFAALLYTSSSCGIWEAMNGDGITRNMTDCDLRAAFSLDINNAVSLLRGYMGKSMHVLQNTDGGLNFIRCSRPGAEHAECAWVDTVECSIPMLRSAIMRWQEELRSIINERLLLGLKLPSGFWDHIGTLQDHFKMDSRGFNVFSRQIHEKFALDCGRMIAEHIGADPGLLHQFFTRTDTTGTEPRKSSDHLTGLTIRGEGPAVNAYLNDCRRALDLGIVLAHTTGGAPARGTELATFLLENTAEEERNFYGFQGQVIFWAIQNKMRSLSSANRSIARFLDMESSRLWLLLVAVVRPFETALVQAKYGEQAAQTQARQLFAYRGKSYSDVQVRRSITKNLKSKKIYLKFAQYRHWQCGIIRIVATSNSRIGSKPLLLQGWGPHRDYECELVNAGGRVKRPSDFMDEQAGHSAATADRHYAQSSESFRRTPTSRMIAFQTASRNWHLLLQIDCDWKLPNPSSHLLGLNGTVLIPKKGSEDTAPPNSSILDQQVLRGGAQIKRFSEACSTPCNTQSKRLRLSEKEEGSDPAERVRKLHDALTSLEQAVYRRHGPTSGVPQAPIIPLKSRRNMIEGLRSVLRNPRAVFSCNIQEEAIYGAILRQRDMIVVMGTGSGKSAIFQTVAYLEGQAAVKEERKPPVTIVVVPLIALVADHLRECSEIPALVAGGWEQRNNPMIQILFLSIEHTIALEFQRLLVKLANERRLTRIIVDECHLTLLWSSFRPSMLRLGFSIQHRSLRIQRILLSATIPPQEVEEMAQIHGLNKSYTVLRQPTTVRNNLSYQVRRCDVPPPRFKQQEAAMVENTYFEIRKELYQLANDISKRHDSYLNGNSTTVPVHSCASDQFFQVTKQQVMVYAPFKNMVEMSCETFCSKKIHSEEFTSSGCTSEPDQETSYVHVVAVVCDVMFYHASLDSNVKKVVQDKWMTGADELYRHQSLQA